MFKKALIWCAWLGGCFTMGFVGGKLFAKGLEWVNDKLAECDD